MFNYDRLQDALLKTYSVDAESYRRKFRESKVNDNETCLANFKNLTLNNWLSLSSIERKCNKL